MKRRRGQSVIREGAPPGMGFPPGHAAKKGRTRWVAVALIVGLVGGAVGVWWGVRNAPARPPDLDLSQAEPAVQRTITRYLDEVRRHPRSGTAWGQLGSVLYAYRLPGPGMVVLAEAERWQPNNARWPYLQGLLVGVKDPAAALPFYRRAVGICGNEPPAPRLRLARVLAELGRWPEAEQELATLREAHPDLPHALFLAAQAARQRGDLSGAVELARRAAAYEVVARPALNLLAALLARQGDAAAAAQAAERATTAPGNELIVDRYDQEALALREDPRSWSEQVHPLMARGRLEAAAAVVARMTGEYPEYADGWLAAGRLAYLQKDAVTAERLLRRHLELERDSVQGWFQLGMALLAQQRNAEAAAVFEKAVTLKPDLSPAWHNRGLALGRLGRREEAMAAFRECLRLSPEHVDTYLLWADLHLQLRQSNEALDLLARAALLAPGDGRVEMLRQKAAAVR